MQAHQHFAEGQKNLAQAASATDPSRLIGLAQGHFLAAQTLMLGTEFASSGFCSDEDRRAWVAAAYQQFGPDGKAV